MHTHRKRRALSLCLAIGCLAVAAGIFAAEPGRAAAAEDARAFLSGAVPRLHIEIPPDGMKVLRAYRQVWRQARPERVDVRATVREGAAIYTNVAIHLKGSFTFQPIDAKPSLTLNFDKFAKGQRFHGLTKIHLNNSVQDPSYLCEALARELFNDIGVAAPRAGQAFVSINGREAGLFVLVEGANKTFLKRHFTSVAGNLYDAGSGGEITTALEVDSGEYPDDRSDLTTLVNAAMEPDPAARFSRLSEVLDLEPFLSFVAGEVLMVHWDGYSLGAPNNYRVFRDAAREKMVFLPHGLDQIFVPVQASATITPNFKGLVARALITTPEGRRRYLERVAELAAGEFTVGALHARVDRLADRVRPALADDGGMRAEFEGNVRLLKARISRRCDIVAQLLREPARPLSFGPDNVVPLSHWRFKTGNTRPARGGRAVERGREVLQVQARGPEMAGSWRTQVLLEQGRYEFTGSARTEGMSQAEVQGTNGVMLRVSGERAPRGTATRAWTTLRYEFEVRGIEDVELVCEFRGAGTGFFDASSMRLVRRGP